MYCCCSSYRDADNADDPGQGVAELVELGLKRRLLRILLRFLHVNKHEVSSALEERYPILLLQTMADNDNMFSCSIIAGEERVAVLQQWMGYVWRLENKLVTIVSHTLPSPSPPSQPLHHKCAPFHRAPRH